MKNYYSKIISIWHSLVLATPQKITYSKEKLLFGIRSNYQLNSKTEDMALWGKLRYLHSENDKFEIYNWYLLLFEAFLWQNEFCSNLAPKMRGYSMTNCGSGLFD